MEYTQEKCKHLTPPSHVGAIATGVAVSRDGHAAAAAAAPWPISLQKSGKLFGEAARGASGELGERGGRMRATRSIASRPKLLVLLNEPADVESRGAAPSPELPLPSPELPLHVDDGNEGSGMGTRVALLGEPPPPPLLPPLSDPPQSVGCEIPRYASTRSVTENARMGRCRHGQARPSRQPTSRRRRVAALTCMA